MSEEELEEHAAKELWRSTSDQETFRKAELIAEETDKNTGGAVKELFDEFRQRLKQKTKKKAGRIKEMNDEEVQDLVLMLKLAEEYPEEWISRINQILS